MKLTQSSLLYRYLKFGHVVSRWDKTIDTCTIFWGTLFTTVLLVAFAAVVAFAAFLCVASPLYELYQWGLKGSFDQASFGFLGSILDGCALVTYLAYLAKTKYDDHRAKFEPVEPVEPSILAQTYRSWKEKTCVIVDIVSDENN